MVTKMAKIDDNVAHALACGDNKSFGNTVVKDGAVYLHGNKIAWLDGRELHLSHCGWVTRTTIQRLNAILVRYMPRIKVGIKQGCAELRFADGTTEPFEGVVVLTKND